MTIKKKLGRPKLAKGEARTEILQIRITKLEMADLENKAASSGKSLSEWARAALIGPNSQ